MSKGRWILTSIVVAAVIAALNAIFHGNLLSGTYETTAALWRTEAVMARLMPYGWLVTLITSVLLVYIFHKGYEGKGSKVAEGLRFGLIIGLFTALPMSVWSYVMIPMTVALAAAWFAIGMVDMLVAGAVVGLLYKRA